MLEPLFKLYDKIYTVHDGPSLCKVIGADGSRRFDPSDPRPPPYVYLIVNLTTNTSRRTKEDEMCKSNFSIGDRIHTSHLTSICTVNGTITRLQPKKLPCGEGLIMVATVKPDAGEIELSEFAMTKVRTRNDHANGWVSEWFESKSCE